MSESTSTPVATAAAVTEAENPSNVGAAETVEVEDVPNDGDSSYDEEVCVLLQPAFQLAVYVF